MEKQRIRVAVIGAGTNSQKNHLPALKRLQDEGVYKLQSVCDLNIDIARDAASRFGFRAYTHEAADVITREDVDVLYVLGTVEMHYQYAKEALVCGKHVFVEKPPTPSVLKALELRALARKHNLTVVVGHNRRFYSNINYVKNLFDEKDDITSVEGVYHKPFLHETYMHGCSSWITYSAFHGIDALVYSMGKPPVALYTANNFISGNVPQNVSALMVWENGAHGVLSSNNSAGSRMERYTLHGAGISYVCEQSSSVEIYSEGEDKVVSLGSLQETRGFYEEHKEFARAVVGDLKPRHSLTESIIILHIAELIEHGHHGSIDWSFLGDATSPRNLVNKKIELSSLENKERKRGSAILVLNPTTLKTCLARLANTCTIVYNEQLPILSKESRENVRAIVTGIGGTPVTEEILTACPNIGVVGIVGASVRKYNPEILIARKIPIINTSDIYARAVAEFNLLQVLVGIKKASQSHDTLRRGGWGSSVLKRDSVELNLRKALDREALHFIKPILKILWRKLPTKFWKQRRDQSGFAAGGKNIAGRRIGLIGFGAITREFIRLLSCFNCSIKVFSKYLTEEEAAHLGVKKAVSMRDVLDADVVSIHRGLSDRTYQSFGEKEFALLKPNTVFVNASRGQILDEEALVERLRKGDIFACLDVFDEEPLAKSSPLRKLPNVFLTSHIAGVTEETFTISPEVLIDKVLKYLAGEDVDYLITSKEMLRNMT